MSASGRASSKSTKPRKIHKRLYQAGAPESSFRNDLGRFPRTVFPSPALESSATDNGRQGSVNSQSQSLYPFQDHGSTPTNGPVQCANPTQYPGRLPAAQLPQSHHHGPPDYSEPVASGIASYQTSTTPPNGLSPYDYNPFALDPVFASHNTEASFAAGGSYAPSGYMDPQQQAWTHASYYLPPGSQYGTAMAVAQNQFHHPPVISGGYQTPEQAPRHIQNPNTYSPEYQVGMTPQSYTAFTTNGFQTSGSNSPRDGEAN